MHGKKNIPMCDSIISDSENMTKILKCELQLSWILMTIKIPHGWEAHVKGRKKHKETKHNRKI